MTWPMVKLGEVFDISSSKRVHQKDWRSEGVPFYRAREVVLLARDGVVDNDLFIEEKMYEDYKEKYGVPHEGDILVTAVGTLGQTYAVKKGDRFYFKDASVILLRKKIELNIPYILHVLNSVDVQRYIKKSDGATVGTYTISRAKETEIPLPPLEEQKRIAAILDKADAIRRKRQQAIKLADDFLRAVFLDMFGDPVTNPKGWEVKPLNSFVSKLGDGLHGTPNYSSEGEYHFINGNNLRNGVIEISDKVKKVSEEEYMKHQKELNESTMLVSINGTIGNVAFYRNEKIVLGKSACYFNVIENSISRIYLYYLIQSEYFLNYVGSVVTGSTIKNVSLKSMREFPVPVPNESLQKDFERKVRAIHEVNDSIIRSKAKGMDLILSLSQKAFSGEL